MNDSFETFETNVIQWAQTRGIFDHSNFEAQIMKAISETGELADAIIKYDRAGLIDAIGDVAVCIVNAHAFYAKNRGRMERMSSHNIEAEFSMEQGWYESRPAHVILGRMTTKLGGCLVVQAADSGQSLMTALYDLMALAEMNHLTFMNCCDEAWNEIKNRKGHMVEGGAFVKEVA